MRQCNSALPGTPHPAAKKSQIRIPEDKSEIFGTYSKTKSGRQQATIHHESTTDSPSKNHVLTTHFHQKPLQNDEISLAKKITHPNSNQRDSPLLTPMGHCS
jgi:hypothetical protein